MMKLEMSVATDIRTSHSAPRNDVLSVEDTLIWHLSDEILPQPIPSEGLNHYCTALVDPIEIDTRLHETLGNLMLADGESFSLDNLPSLGLHVGSAEPTDVRVSAAGWNSPSVPAAADQSHPRPRAWIREIGVSLTYSGDDPLNAIVQTLSAQAARSHIGIPVLSRVVTSTVYAELLGTTYMGHHYVERIGDPRAIRRFILLAEDLFEAYLEKQS